MTNRLAQVRAQIKQGPKTLAEIGAAIGISRDLARYYVKHLVDAGQVACIEEGQSGNVYAWAIADLPRYTPPPPEPEPEPAPEPEKPTCTRVVPADSRAVLIHGPKRNTKTLTRWVGGNPFEKYRKAA